MNEGNLFQTAALIDELFFTPEVLAMTALILEQRRKEADLLRAYEKEEKKRAAKYAKRMSFKLLSCRACAASIITGTINRHGDESSRCMCCGTWTDLPRGYMDAMRSRSR